jgi:stage III sporulation protein AE
MDALGVRLSLSALGDRVKKWYVSILGLVMFLLSLTLSGRSILVGQADTLGMKGIKYAVSSMIPVVGGAVSGTLSTVAVGIGALRGICGVAGIFLLALLLLPTLIHLLLTRALLNLTATVASLLSCDGEAKLLGEMASLQGYLAAAVSICAVLLVMALTILIHSGTALG